MKLGLSNIMFKDTQKGQTHFENDHSGSSAMVNFAYLKDKSKVVVAADIKPGVSVERIDEGQNVILEALRLQKLKEIMVMISEKLFED